jgi:short-subunit dehydrogenase
MAERCAPIDNARAVARRMPPERLAELVLDAVRRRKRVLIPGAANGAMAFAGRLFPSLTDSIMRRAIFEKLRKDLD